MERPVKQPFEKVEEPGGVICIEDDDIEIVPRRLLEQRGNWEECQLSSSKGMGAKFLGTRAVKLRQSSNPA